MFSLFLSGILFSGPSRISEVHEMREKKMTTCHTTRKVFLKGKKHPQLDMDSSGKNNTSRYYFLTIFQILVFAYVKKKKKIVTLITLYLYIYRLKSSWAFISKTAEDELSQLEGEECEKCHESHCICREIL